MESKQDLHVVVDDIKDADAVAWGFLKQGEDNMSRILYKFRPLLDHEIRLQVEWSSICRTDVTESNSDWVDRDYPQVPGHEILGTVCATGSKVRNFKIGDRVGYSYFRWFCGACEECYDGFQQNCHSRKNTFDGLRNFGGFSTHFQGSEVWATMWTERLWKPECAPLLCAGITVFAPLRQYCKAGDDVAVIGIGGLGHVALAFARAIGCRVTAFSGKTKPEEIEKIKAMGAHYVVNSRDLKLVGQHAMKYDQVLQTSPGADKDFDCAYQGLAKRNGHYVQVGIPTRQKTQVISHMPLIFHQKHYDGSLLGNVKDYQKMVVVADQCGVEAMIEQFQFDKFPEAWNRMLNGKPHFRVCVSVGEWARDNGLHKVE